MINIDSPSVGRSTEQDISNLKNWCIELIGQLNYQIGQLENEIASLKAEIGRMSNER